MGGRAVINVATGHYQVGQARLSAALDVVAPDCIKGMFAAAVLCAVALMISGAVRLVGWGGRAIANQIRFERDHPCIRAEDQSYVIPVIIGDSVSMITGVQSNCVERKP